MTEANFCLHCGQALETREMNGTQRRACPSCDYVHWGSYSVGVGALIRRDGRMLLVRRAQEPGKGLWTNPGGYIEQFEPIAETIAREVMEECGVEATVRSLVAVRDQPRGVHNVYLAFEMDYVSGEPQPDGVEVDAAGFFSPAEMETMPVAAFTRWLADVSVRGRSAGLTADEAPIVPLNGYGLFRRL